MLATRSGCSRCTLLAMRIRHVLMLATRWHERKRTILVLLESQFNFVRENVDRSKKLNCSWHIMPHSYVAPCFGYGPASRVLWNDVTGAGCPQATEKKACLKKTYWSYVSQIFETRLSKSSSFREQRYLNTGSGPYCDGPKFSLDTLIKWNLITNWCFGFIWMLPLSLPSCLSMFL